MENFQQNRLSTILMYSIESEIDSSQIDRSCGLNRQFVQNFSYEIHSEGELQLEQMPC